MTDPPLSVIARARGPLVEITITGDGTDQMPDMTATISVEDANQLKLDILDAISDAKRAKKKGMKGP